MNRPARASVPALAGVALLAACNQSAPDIDQYGANPELPDQHRGLLPNMTIARPALWGDRVPTVPEGYSIRAIATDLGIPRQTLALPNGDIHVAEGRGGNAGQPKTKEADVGYIKATGNTEVKHGNRLTLQRDGDRDSSPELNTVLANKHKEP